MGIDSHRSTRAVALVAFVASTILSRPSAAQGLCRVTCMPDETRDAAGCCVAANSTAEGGATASDRSVGCPDGRLRSQEGGPCCYPNQVVHLGVCRGVPTSCPAGYVVDTPNETCALVPCEPGKERAEDGVTCCYPGQVTVGGACRGVPSSCPDDRFVDGETCRRTPSDLLVSIDPSAASAARANPPSSASFRFRGASGTDPLFACDARTNDACTGHFEMPSGPLRVDVEIRDAHGWRQLPIADAERSRELETGRYSIVLTGEQPTTPRRPGRFRGAIVAFAIAAATAPPLIVRSREQRDKDSNGVYHRTGAGLGMLGSGIAIAVGGTVALCFLPVAGRGHRLPPRWHLEWGNGATPNGASD